MGMWLDSLLVNDHGHAGLAVLALRAVQPHGLGVLDHDGVGRDHALGRTGSDGLVAGEEARDGGVVLVDRSARVVKVGLDDAVVTSTELELDHVASGSLQVVGREDEFALGACDGHYVDIGLTLGKSGTGKDSGEESGELHLD